MCQLCEINVCSLPVVYVSSHKFCPNCHFSKRDLIHVSSSSLSSPVLPVQWQFTQISTRKKGDGLNFLGKVNLASAHTFQFTIFSISKANKSLFLFYYLLSALLTAHCLIFSFSSEGVDPFDGIIMRFSFYRREYKRWWRIFTFHSFAISTNATIMLLFFRKQNQISVWFHYSADRWAGNGEAFQGGKKFAEGAQKYFL